MRTVVTVFSLLLPTLLLLVDFACAQPVNTTSSDEYEYIVVGSGPGGGTLASRLARAGHKTLLIEAGDDQSANLNVTVPGYMAAVTEDKKLRWDIFVNHYKDQQRAQRDPKYVWETSPFEYHVGPGAPDGAEPRGILYPRAQTIGGCGTHNALIWILPHESDWNNIAGITGDSSWSAANMKQYEQKVFSWLHTQPTDPTILINDLSLAQQYVAGAAAAGIGPDPINAVTGLVNLLLNDPNSQINPQRDSTEGFFQVPLTMNAGTRTGVYQLIKETVKQGYPLTVQTNTFVTKIVIDQSNSTAPPKATGVEFQKGKYLYRASPLSVQKNPSTAGSAKATREVIVSGGAYNTPQLLKLSGIGPKQELEQFKIPVIKDLQGVGKNLQDRYEIPVNVQHTKDFNILKGCTFDSKPHDQCLKQWQNNPYILGQRGAYATNGLAAAIVKRSSYASDSNTDLIIFGGPVNFDGYYPGWAEHAIADHKHFSWYTLKAHTRNHAGTVELRSADPFDPPSVNFNYFDTGTTENGADQLDLQAIVQAINTSRSALAEYSHYGLLGGPPFTEEAPGPAVQTEAELQDYVKDRAWGHHASCTTPIGSDNDPNAVLDGQFRVRGVDGLRVVDASVFPQIPGVFIQAPIYIISEKAADVILSAAK
ncbi:alcohol oxidase [Acaromyces ingoldii]|uniref:Alcohol oxidase n=1 Tax=Acaromyces ingoldii TaxID=215250 RepID=A0A316YGP5_9BASI|nr:alcohol oxidase [Acaromyces ingoldii]PWN88014.1 alcohol oxidase [Acaromyces ingoldii]